MRFSFLGAEFGSISSDQSDLEQFGGDLGTIWAIWGRFGVIQGDLIIFGIDLGKIYRLWDLKMLVMGPQNTVSFLPIYKLSVILGVFK